MPIPGTRPSPKMISITGDQGSGKSTVATALSKEWDVRHYYAGGVLRELALERGMTIHEITNLATMGPDIHHQVDEVFRKLAQASTDSIGEGRVAWHFLPASFKIKLTVCARLAAERIFRDKMRKAEHVDNPNDILKTIHMREAADHERYKTLYDVDIHDDHNFDLMIDTANVNPDEVTRLVMRLSTKHFSDEPTEKQWVCPRSIYPTLMPNVTEHGLELPPDEFDHAPIMVVDIGRLYFIVDGHTRTSKAVMAGVPFIPVRSIKADEIIPGKGVTGMDFYRQNLNFSAIKEWETIHGFTYPIMPDAL